MTGRRAPIDMATVMMRVVVPPTMRAVFGEWLSMTPPTTDAESVAPRLTDVLIQLDASVRAADVVMLSATR